MTAEDIIQRRKELWEQYHDIETDRQFVRSVAEYIVGAEGEAIRNQLLATPELLIEMAFILVDKKKNTRPFFLNAVQRNFDAELRKALLDFTDGKRNSLKFIVLKGRQQGFTTYITARQLAYAILTKNFTGTTIADNSENTTTIFEDKARFIYNSLPDLIKPTPKYNNRREFHFEKLNSRWRISTAGNDNAGRSQTLNFLHGSEVAFWDSIDTIVSALDPALTKDSLQILETTANGFNEFKDLWDDAVSGNNNWQPLFYEWWLTPEYSMDFESEEVEAQFKELVESEYDDFCAKLNWLKGKGLSWEQLYWYANKKKDLKDKLEQEYPCTPEEAFLTSGRPYFDVQKIQEILRDLADTPKQDGDLRVFSEPVKGKQYAIGADVAEGLEEGDYSHAKVFDTSTWEEVAFVHGHFSTDHYGDLLIELAQKYNGAYLGVERNNHGHAVLNHVYKYKGYFNIYLETTHDKKSDKPTKKLGWYTSEKSKYLMLDELDTAIRQDEIKLQDKEALKEMLTVVKDENGAVEISGKDRVAATAIAWQMRKFATTITEKKPKPYIPHDYHTGY